MKEKIYDLKWCGKIYKIFLEKTKYVNNGTLAINMISIDKDGNENYFNTLTVNLVDSCIMADANYFQYVDTNNLSEKIVDWLVKNKIAEASCFYGFSGFCKYPLMIFTDEALEGMRRA